MAAMKSAVNNRNSYKEMKGIMAKTWRSGSESWRMQLRRSEMTAKAAKRRQKSASAKRWRQRRIGEISGISGAKISEISANGGNENNRK